MLKIALEILMKGAAKSSIFINEKKYPAQNLGQFYSRFYVEIK